MTMTDAQAATTPASVSQAGATPDLASWVAITQQAATLLDPKSLVKTFWNKQTRPDGRLFSQSRRTVVQRSVVTQHAAGSAMVQTGLTQVLAAVSYSVGQPVGSSQGDILVTIQDGRASSSMDSALQLRLQRVLEETLDMDQLQIVPNEAAFRLNISVQVLNNDGNLHDACMLACTAALADTKLPANTVWQDGRVWLKEQGDDDIVDDDSAFCALKLPVLPIPLTMGVWYDAENDTTHLLVDPAADEERILSSKVTVVVNGVAGATDTDTDEQHEILSLELSGCVAVTKTELALATKLAAGRAKELRDVLLPESVGEE